MSTLDHGPFIVKKLMFGFLILMDKSDAKKYRLPRVFYYRLMEMYTVASKLDLPPKTAGRVLLHLNHRFLRSMKNGGSADSRKFFLEDPADAVVTARILAEVDAIEERDHNNV